MKTRFLPLAAAVALAGCGNPSAPSAHGRDEAVASYKEGHGVHLPEAMRRSLRVEVADVEEQPLAPRERIPLHVFRSASVVEAGGWVGADVAKSLPVGTEVRLELPDGKIAGGVVTRLRRSPTPALGDHELVVATAAALELGMKIAALVDLPQAGDVVAVPAASVVKGAEGDFVYVTNEEYFARTPVRTGAKNERLVEIEDGLYAGDSVVVSGAQALWMTELQSRRAGQACTHGH